MDADYEDFWAAVGDDALAEWRRVRLASSEPGFHDHRVIIRTARYAEVR